MANLRVAIIGYGLAGRFLHARLIDATLGLEVATVVTSSAERASQAMLEHPGVQVVARPEQLWEAGHPDLVVVATPNEMHASLAADAIDHGVPVVVDKPLAVSVGQAEALVARAEDAGVLLTVFQNRRWDTDHLTLRRLIAEGALGEVVRYESRFERWRPEPDLSAWRVSASLEDGGGQLLDLGSHLIDQAVVLFGPVTHVYAEIENRRARSSDDDVFLALWHASGTISHLHAGSVMPSPGPRLRVQGTDAGFLVSGLDPQEAALRSGVRPDTSPNWGQHEEWERGRLVAGDQNVPVPGEPGDWPRFYALLEQALRQGGAPPVDPRDAVGVLRVVAAARQSSAARAPVAPSD
ncbi:MAG: Gfo/Idh/MocA family protein [Solirubrobacteraceae bacterium]